MNIHEEIKKLACYALEKGLIEEDEVSYSINLLLDVLNLDEFNDDGKFYSDVDLEDVLSKILDYAYEAGLIKENTIVYRDLFDTKIMNCFTPRPSQVEKTFCELEKESPKKATDYFYHLSLDSDYIRSYRIKKDIKWTTKTVYGNIDITINLSKPEKDPKAIAAAKLQKQTSYPKCLLCKENMGYRGTLLHPARQTIRYIPLDLDGEKYFMQYSPYSYYPEHCIVFNCKHIPMTVSRKTFDHLISFVRRFPHYMLGSNADLPIVGGSILSHDHYQGGNYVFPMFKAKDVFTYTMKSFPKVKISYLYWPLSVIRLRSSDTDSLTELSDRILLAWREYTDESLTVFAKTDGIAHNTITPILHFEDGEYVMDLALRNNLTNERYPLGIYHPHQEYWNIKKENIGLIEVMGTAILPSRLKGEMAALKNHILHHEDIASDPLTEKHAQWVKSFQDELVSLKDEEEVESILRKKIGETFQKVLECAGVFKQNEEGYEGVRRFLSSID